MSRETQNILVLLIGLSTGLIAVKGTYLNFVKPALFPWLLVAAVLLVALAVVCLVRDLRRARIVRGGEGTMAARAIRG